MYTVFRSEDRMITTGMPGVTSCHSFSFGDHYDPGNTHHGVLLACNSERLAAGSGFDTHAHRAVDIVTWVLGGALVHQDSEGHGGAVYPGLAQRMSAGTGILHSERNDPIEARAVAAGPDSPDGPDGPDGPETRFVQMWILPDDAAAAPSYQQREVDQELAGGSLIPIASGDPRVDSAIRIGNATATLYVARPRPGGTVELPDARFGHLLVTGGRVEVDGIGELSDGDALRLMAGGARTITARTGGTEILYWQMQRSLGE